MVDQRSIQPLRRGFVLAGIGALAVSALGAADAIWLASHSSAGPSAAGNGSTTLSAMSADGRYVAFASTATDAVAGALDTNEAEDTFLWDRETNAVRLVSRAAGTVTTAAAGASRPSAISADGRYVLFNSTAYDLVADGSDANSANDVYLWDRDTGSVTLISRVAGTTTTAGNGTSSSSAMSADGRFVAFQSTATNLIAGGSDTNNFEDAFLWDRTNGSVVLISRAAGTSATAGNHASFPKAISSDGRFVAIESWASNLIAGGSEGNGTYDAFLWDRQTGAFALVSRSAASATTTGNGRSTPVAISASGRYVAFSSAASDLIGGGWDPFGHDDAFFWDRDTGLVTLVSHAPGAGKTAGTGRSVPTAISGDGRYVAFHSVAPDLIAGGSDQNQSTDAFLWDRDTGVVTLISRAAGTTTTAANGESRPMAISANGRYVAFDSSAPDLIVGGSDANGARDVILWDRITGENELLSHVADSEFVAANAESVAGPISADGQTIVFRSAASNLMPGTFNDSVQTFVRRFRLFADGFESRNTLAWAAEVPGLPVPDAFRWTDLDLRDPHVYVQSLGCNDHTPHGAQYFSVNDELAASLVTDSNDDGFLDRTQLTVFRPLDPEAIGGRLDEGPARCLAPDPTAGCVWTNPTAMTPVTFAYDTLPVFGTCLEPVAGTTTGSYTPAMAVPTAPCFLASLGTVTIDFFGVSVPLHDTRIGAELVGDPPESLANGLTMGFLRQADADQILIPANVPLVGGAPLSSLFPGGQGNCAGHDDRDTWEGQSGWWVHFNFVASPVDFVGR